MTLTRKINHKTHKKTRRQRGGMMKALRGMFNRGGPAPGGPPPGPPPPLMTADNVRLFNALNLGWQIAPDSTDYEIFNVAQNADNATLTDSFNAIARAIRPITKKSKSPEEREYVRLRALLRTKQEHLIDPVTRQQYDELLRYYPKAPPPPPPNPPGPPVPPSGSGGPPVPPLPVPKNKQLATGVPLPIPVVAAGVNVTFLNTQVPNPLQIVRGPPPPPIINTLVGQRIQAIENIIRGDPAQDPLLNYLDGLLQYPESSNLENYVLITTFLPAMNVSILMASLNDVLREKKTKEIGTRVGLGGVFDLFSIVQDPGQAIVPDRISATKLLSLMILSSRLSPKYRLRTNPESLLFTQLNALFDDGNGPDFASGQITDILENFIRTNPTVTISYLTNLINGTTVYSIYKTYYTDEEKEISQGLIKTRLGAWLKTPVLETPISFLFNTYTNAEKARLNSDSAICQPISDVANNIGKPTIPKSLLPKSVFNVDENDNVDFDKLNAFLRKLGPAAAAAVKNSKKGKK
jgi:hypothetical protein